MINNKDVAVLRHKARCGTLYAVDGRGGFDRVKYIPYEEVDPEDSGIKSYVAFTNSGYIDLLNAEKEDFVIVTQALGGVNE